jgi:hypothetical protein
MYKNEITRAKSAEATYISRDSPVEAQRCSAKTACSACHICCQPIEFSLEVRSRRRTPVTFNPAQPTPRSD